VSFSLYWRPVPKEIPPARDLPYELKRIVGQRWFGHDGTIRGECVLTSRDIAYLEGIADANGGEASEGATELINAIREHDTVTLWIGDADD
jgi:hypothetical protein